LVSYTISERPVLGMVTSILEKAFDTIPDGTELILHSDQGWQYQHKQYQRMLEAKGIRQSMSRKGNCLDNAVMENFFGLLKTELLYLQDFDSMEHFKEELIDYLNYYNNHRIKLKLKGLTPAQHRCQTLHLHIPMIKTRSKDRVFIMAGVEGLAFLRKSHGGCDRPPACRQEPPFKSFIFP